MVAMTTTARRPLNWNLLDHRLPHAGQDGPPARGVGRGPRQPVAGSSPSTMPTLVPMNMSFRTHCALFLIPGWGDVMGLPGRGAHREAAGPGGAGPARRGWPTRRVPASSAACRHWANYIIGDTFAPENEATAGATSGPSPTSRASRRSTPCSTWSSPTTCAPCCGPRPPTATPPRGRPGSRCGTTRGPWWAGPTPGAHLDRMCGSNYPTSFLGDCLRKRKLVPDGAGRPADDRGPGRPVRPRTTAGRVAEGLRADLFVFDPETVASEPATLVERPARRKPAADRRRHRRGPGAGQRGRDHRRRQAHRRPPGHAAARRARTRVTVDPAGRRRTCHSPRRHRPGPAPPTARRCPVATADLHADATSIAATARITLHRHTAAARPSTPQRGPIMGSQVTKDETQLLIGGQVGRGRRRHLRHRQPGHRGGRGPGPQRLGGRRRGGRGRGPRRLPGLGRHPGRGAPGPAARRRPAAIRAKNDELVPAGHRRDRGHRVGRLPHAGAGQRRPLRPVLPGHPPRPGVRCSPRSSPRPRPSPPAA